MQCFIYAHLRNIALQLAVHAGLRHRMLCNVERAAIEYAATGLAGWQRKQSKSSEEVLHHLIVQLGRLFFHSLTLFQMPQNHCKPD